jgi:hypothetical protein
MSNPEKRVGERRLYTMSFEEQPEIKTGGEVIASTDSITATSPDLVLEIPNPSFDDKHSQVWLSAGTPGSCHVIYTVTTDQGSRLVGDMRLRVIAD